MARQKSQIAADILTKRQTNSDSSPLLRLPAELRKETYKLALSAETPVTITHTDIRDRSSILQVCHQIRLEARPIFYSANSFKITNVSDPYIDRFLENATTSMLRQIPEIHIRPSIADRSLGEIAKLLRETASRPPGRRIIDSEDPAISVFTAYLWSIAHLANLMESYKIKTQRIHVRQQGIPSGKPTPEALIEWLLDSTAKSAFHDTPNSEDQMFSYKRMIENYPAEEDLEGDSEDGLEDREQ